MSDDELPTHTCTTLLTKYEPAKKKNAQPKRRPGTTNKALDEFDDDMEYQVFLKAAAHGYWPKYILKPGKTYSFLCCITTGNKAPR
jgi:hypothetical protein